MLEKEEDYVVRDTPITALSKEKLALFLYN